MKKQISALLFIFLMFPALAFAIGTPTSVTFTNVTQTSIIVNWVGVSNADHYNIYLGTSTSNMIVDNTVPVGTLQFTKNGLTQNTHLFCSGFRS